MGLYKRGTVWWMRLTYNGRQIRKSTEVKNKNLAMKIHAKVLTEINEGKWFERLPGDEKTFSELMDKYMAEHSAVNKAKSTHAKSQSTVKHLYRCFGKRIVTDIRPRDISAYRTARQATGAAPKTVNGELMLMGHAYSLAMKEWEWVTSNPVSMWYLSSRSTT